MHQLGRAARPSVAVEDVRHVGGRDTDPGVLDAQQRPGSRCVAPLGRQGGGQGARRLQPDDDRPAVRRVLDRVGEQVVEQLAEAVPIAGDRQRRQRQGKGHRVARRAGTGVLHGRPRQRPELHPGRLELADEPAPRRRHGVELRLHDPEQLPGGGLGLLDVPVEPRRHRRLPSAGGGDRAAGELEVAEDGGHRRAQVVDRHRQPVLLRPRPIALGRDVAADGDGTARRAVRPAQRFDPPAGVALDPVRAAQANGHVPLRGAGAGGPAQGEVARSEQGGDRGGVDRVRRRDPPVPIPVAEHGAEGGVGVGQLPLLVADGDQVADGVDHGPPRHPRDRSVGGGRDVVGANRPRPRRHRREPGIVLRLGTQLARGEPGLQSPQAVATARVVEGARDQAGAGDVVDPVEADGARRAEGAEQPGLLPGAEPRRGDAGEGGDVGD